MAKDKPSRQEIKDRGKDLVHNIYEHGGSRIFVDGESGERCLLIDTYYTKQFAEYMEKCVRQFFEIAEK